MKRIYIQLFQLFSILFVLLGNTRVEAQMSNYVTTPNATDAWAVVDNHHRPIFSGLVNNSANHKGG
jgi:hypothetical protein